MSVTIPKTTLFLSSVWAVYVLWIVPYQNGLLKSLIDLQKPGTYLPGTKMVPMRHHYTGIKPLDNQIAMMVAFFWPALDGSRVDVSLVFLEIVTQAMATWVLVTIESVRVGNKGKWYITSITTAGVLMQNLGYGLIVPLWTCLHLAYSPTINSSTAAPLASSNPLPLLTLPFSAILAFYVPNFLMALTPPNAVFKDHSSKQFYTALSQLWPVSISVSQLILPMAISIVTPGINALTERDKKVKSLKYLRRCYTFALIATTSSHLIAFGIPLLAHLFPALFSLAYLPQLQFANVCVPRSPLPPVQRITSVVDGILVFVQWDLLIGSLAVLIWAVTLRVQAQVGRLGAYEWLEGLVKLTALVCVSGPVGAAVAVVWERDEMFFERDLEKEARERKGK